MKTTILSLCLLATSLVACNNDDDADLAKEAVPSVVQNALNMKFQNLQNLEWEQTDSLYEAEFDLNSMEHKVLINAAGELVQHKMDIPLTSLPPAVAEAAAQVCPGQQMEEVEQVEKGSLVYYQVEFDNRSCDRKLVYSPEGAEITNQPYWD